MKKITMMTEGNIWKQLFLFAIPLILGNLLQQLYNTVDSIIVGNYIGREALAAVGSSGSIINLLIGFCVGTSAGAGVVISQFYGAQDQESLEKAVHTTVAISIVAGFIMTAAGILLAPVLLHVMGTPDEVMRDAVLYLRIFFGGILFSVIYNMSAGILNAVGNSMRSLLYLAVAALSNMILDYVFVVIIGMGVEGVALATDISQLLSCVLILLFLTRSKKTYRLVMRNIRLHMEMVRKIIRIGIPTGIQNIVISFSNVIVQSSINSFGTYAMAGFAAYVKIDGFNLLPILSFSMAATTFAGQNLGAGHVDRVKKGMKISVAMGVVYALLSGTLLIVFSGPLIEIFSKDPKVVKYGVEMFWYFCPFYFILAYLQVLSGTLRGTGNTVETMVIFLLSLCVARIVWIMVLLKVSHDIRWIYLSYPFSWLLGAVIISLYAWKGKWILEQTQNT